MIWRLQIKIQEQKNELYIRIKCMNQNTKANDVKMSNRVNKQILRKEVEWRGSSNSFLLLEGELQTAIKIQS